VLPAKKVEEIRKGTGKWDLASDGVALVALYQDHEGALRGKNPFTTQDFEQLEAASEWLLDTLNPDGAARTSTPARGEPEDMRDRLWTLLARRYVDLRKIAYYFHGDAFEAFVPKLQSRLASSGKDQDDTEEEEDGDEDDSDEDDAGIPPDGADSPLNPPSERLPVGEAARPPPPHACHGSTGWAGSSQRGSSQRGSWPDRPKEVGGKGEEVVVGRCRGRAGRVAAGVEVIDRSGRNVSATALACEFAADRRSSGASQSG
jgi:hypothetical protein